MSSYKPWKALERRHAKRMGGVRIWRQDFSEEKPDGENETDTWDCKAISGQRVVTLFRECERKYREFTGDRHFHLCLFDPRQPRVGDLVVCRAPRYAELEEKEKLLDGFLQAFTEEVGEGCVCAETSTRNCPAHANP